MNQSQERLDRAMRLVGETPGASNPRKKKLDEPTVPERLHGLREYLAIDADPYDFTYLIEDYYEALDRDPPASFDRDDHFDFFSTPEGQAVADDFKRWLLKEGLDQAEAAGDAHAPAYLHFDVRGPVLPPDTWLVHFVDEPESVGRDGFAYGHEDERTLGLTTHFVDSVRKNGPGWNFAFRATSPDARNAASARKYGRNAVLFQAPGVRVYHWGDEEEQVIFWGPSVRQFILLHRSSEVEWGVADARSGEFAREGYFRDVVEWATDHFDDRGVRLWAKPRRARKASDVRAVSALATRANPSHCEPGDAPRQVSGTHRKLREIRSLVRWTESTADRARRGAVRDHVLKNGGPDIDVHPDVDWDGFVRDWSKLRDEEVSAMESAVRAAAHRDGIPLLAVGSSRAVFRLGDDQVVKVSLSLSSDEQTPREVGTWRTADREMAMRLCPVLATGPGWLVMPLADVERQGEDGLRSRHFADISWDHAEANLGLLCGRTVLVDYGL